MNSLFTIVYTAEATEGVRYIKSLNDPLLIDELLNNLSGIQVKGMKFGKPLNNNGQFDYTNYNRVAFFNGSFRIIFTESVENTIEIVKIAPRTDIYNSTPRP